MVLLAVVVEVVVEVVDVVEVEVLVVIQHRTVPISQDFPKVYSILSFGQSERDKHLHWFSLSSSLIIVGSFTWTTSLINSSSAVFKTSEKKMANQHTLNWVGVQGGGLFLKIFGKFQGGLPNF